MPYQMAAGILSNFLPASGGSGFDWLLPTLAQSSRYSLSMAAGGAEGQQGSQGQGGTPGVPPGGSTGSGGSDGGGTDQGPSQQPQQQPSYWGLAQGQAPQFSYPGAATSRGGMFAKSTYNPSGYNATGQGVLPSYLPNRKGAGMTFGAVRESANPPNSPVTRQGGASGNFSNMVRQPGQSGGGATYGNPSAPGEQGQVFMPGKPVGSSNVSPMPQEVDSMWWMPTPNQPLGEGSVGQGSRTQW